jgi:hypothetical protein
MKLPVNLLVREPGSILALEARQAINLAELAGHAACVGVHGGDHDRDLGMLDGPRLKNGVMTSKR